MMMDDLLQRLSEATKPDRALDAQIVVALNILPDRLQGARGTLWVDLSDKRLGPVVRFKDEAIKARGIGNPPIGSIRAYTASIDAALTLVPGRWHWRIDDTLSAAVSKDIAGFQHEYGLADFSADGATPAIAVCLAAIRARAAISKATTA